jgi:nucleotide-binding universal stress UspA family protein
MRIASTAPVVVGVNGTSAGLAAVRLAARESVARHRPLRVVHAFAWPAYDASATGEPYDDLRHRAAEVLERAVTTATRSSPAARVSGYLVDGMPTRVLLQQSRTAGLLVLGDDDLAATVRLPTDSVLVQVVARAQCPVLVARGVGPSDGPVIVGVDGSPASVQALRYAVAEAALRHASVEALHVREPKENGEPDTEDDEAAARDLLDAVLADADLPHAVPFRSVGLHAGAPPVPIRSRLLIGDPAEVLIRQSARARLLVVGPRGTEGHFGALLGAVAQTVLRRSGCPTVFVHGTVAERLER